MVVDVEVSAGVVGALESSVDGVDAVADAGTGTVADAVASRWQIRR